MTYQGMKKTKKEKLRAQVKSRWYYIFWGTATVSVFVGQLYVGSGYRLMSKSFDRIVDTLVIEIEEQWSDNPPRHPMIIQ
tara:strand:+ start:539 stop:778 length:240 start_codon:yes stop_codon:yes gene_type:complete